MTNKRKLERDREAARPLADQRNAGLARGVINGMGEDEPFFIGYANWPWADRIFWIAFAPLLNVVTGAAAWQMGAML